MRPSENLWKRIPNGNRTDSSRVDHSFVHLFLDKQLPATSTFLIYTVILCIICNTHSITLRMNPVSALKPDTDQQSSYDSCHKEKHLTQSSRQAWVVKSGMETRWPLDTDLAPTQLPDVSSRQRSPVGTKYL